MKIMHEGKLHRSAVALGMFDGVHMGHRAVIDNAVSAARARNIPAVIYSFSAHPRTLLSSENVPLLTEPDEKEALFSSLGADILYSEHLTPSFLSLSPEQFMRDVIKERLGAEYISVGYNYRFGAGGMGDAARLLAFGEAEHITVSVIPEVRTDDLTVSSTAIRTALKTGDLSRAEKMLGRPYSFSGTVQKGRSIGKLLGFPTLNLPLSGASSELPHGVYAAHTSLGGTTYLSLLNIGMRPTFGASEPLAEVHLIGFSGDAYGMKATVIPLEFLRCEKHFPNPDDLKVQIAKDYKKVVDRWGNL